MSLNRVENLFIYWPERHNLGPGKKISANLSIGEATGPHLTGLLKQSVIPTLVNQRHGYNLICDTF